MDADEGGVAHAADQIVGRVSGASNDEDLAFTAPLTQEGGSPFLKQVVPAELNDARWQPSSYPVGHPVTRPLDGKASGVGRGVQSNVEVTEKRFWEPFQGDPSDQCHDRSATVATAVLLP